MSWAVRCGRYDLQLDLAPPVREALAELLETVKPLVVQTLGGDAEYATEPPQPCHKRAHRSCCVC